MSLAEIGAALRMVLDTLTQARVLRAASATSAASARDQIASLAQGSGNPTLDHATASLTAGVNALDQADALTVSAMTDVVEYGRRLGFPLKPPLAQPPAPSDPAAAGDTPARDSRDSRGRVVPPGVTRLPSGRYPANFQYAGRVYDGPRWTPDLAAKYPDGVRFTDDGFPDFEPYATAKVTIAPTFAGNHTTDFAAANAQAGLDETPDDCTWHHHQDTRTMLLVPADLHYAVRHAGGVSIMKGRT